MSTTRQPLRVTRQDLEGGQDLPESVSAQSTQSAAAALVAGTMLRQHRRAGGRADGELSLLDAVTRLWQAIGAGDVCLPLELTVKSADGAAPPDATLLADLTRSPVVMVDPAFNTDQQAAADPRPLVVSQGRLSSYRYWLAEHRLADRLIAMAEAPLPASSGQREHGDKSTLGRAQRAALVLASQRRLVVLTGGPGTGKTYTLAAIVRDAAQAATGLANPCEDSTGATPAPFAIAVAAPTGKATARIAAAIGQALTDQANTLLQAMTLHRLLGLNASGHHDGAAERLPFDLIVIDESSMLDTLMASRLVSSLRPDTQLVFAGDRDQLASVQAGAFFGTLCTTDDKRIAACRIELDENYRQKEAPEILAWANAVRIGKLDALQDDTPGLSTGHQVLFEPGGPQALIRRAVDHLRPLVAAAMNAHPDDGVPLIRQALQVQVLAMLRSGAEGVNALNESISAALRALAGDVSSEGARWFAGRLVVIRKNAAHRSLFNGDIGLCVSLPDGDQRGLRVVFEQADGTARYVLPSQMPAHEDAWALTVHQAQGSDFDEVLFLPAPAGHSLATREGLYTAITRARRKISIFGTKHDVAAAAARPESRESGLMDALAASGRTV